MAVQIRDRIVKFERVPIANVKPNPANWKVHPPHQRFYLRTVLEEIGFAGAGLAYQDPEWGLTYIDGHMRAQELEAAGLDTMPTLIADVTREEAQGLLATYDPLGQLYEKDELALEALVSSMDPAEEAAQLRKLAASDADGLVEMFRGDGGAWEAAGAVGSPPAPPSPDGTSETDPTPEPSDPDRLTPSKADELDGRLDALVTEWKVARGQLWVIPSRTTPYQVHRIYVGDAQKRADVVRLVGNEPWPDMILTDPPYCSGGFQEAGRSAGSVGTKADVKRVASDTLSTRGYIALLNKVLDQARARVAYVFTDWRMWTSLFDVLEGQRYGVRQMLVWDKGTPGMGQGWRSQHELVMMGLRLPLKFDLHKATGNVLHHPRTGNQWHTTQKPVELLREILDTTPRLESGVYDPMLGSGTTILAAERAGWIAYGMEQDPVYVAAALHRLKTEAGLEPRLAHTAR